MERSYVGAHSVRPQTRIGLAKLLQTIKEECLFQRLAVYVLGLFIAAFGVAFAINSELGISPINSFPFVLSQMFGLYMGTCVTILLCFFVLLQIILLRREFKPVNLIQLFFAFLFGYFVDFTRFLLGDFHIPTYFGQMAMMGIAMVLVATGITLFVSSRLAPLPAESLVAAMAYQLDMPFHKVKIVMDTTVVTSGIVLSLMFLGGLYGVREGTVVSAVLIGKMIPQIRKTVAPTLLKLGVMQASA